LNISTCGPTCFQLVSGFQVPNKTILGLLAGYEKHIIYHEPSGADIEKIILTNKRYPLS